METVGAYQAKTHLARLLEKVARGETVTFTKHGVPVAVLVPHPQSRKLKPAEVINSLREFRGGLTLGGVSVRDLIEEGRR